MAVFRLEAVFDVLTGKAVTQLRDMEKSTESAAAKVKRLEQQLEKTRAVADRKAAQIARLEKAVAAGGVGAEKAAAKLDKMRKSLEDTQARAGQLGSQLGAARAQMNSFGGQLERVSAMALRFAGPAVLGALSAALIKLGADAVQFGVSLHDAMKRFQAATGASAAETDRFRAALVNLHRVNTDSIENLAAALTVVRREFGRLGDQLEPMTQAFLDFSKVAGVDAAQSVDEVKASLDAWGFGAGQVGPVLDRLRRISELTGENVLDLNRAMQDGAPVAQAMHVSFDEYASVLGAFADRGLKAEAANKGLLKILDAVAAPTKENTAAFDRLGLAVDKAGRPVGGVRAVFGALLDRMKDGVVDGNDLAAVTGLVGDRLARDFANGCKVGRDGIAAMNREVEQAAEANARAGKVWDEQFGERWELLKRKHFDPSIAAMGQAFGWLLNEGLKWLDVLLTAIGQIGQALGHMATELEGTFTQLFGGVQDLFVGLVAVIKGALADLLDSLAVAMDQLPGLVKDQLGTLQQDTQKVAGLLRQGNQQDLARGEQGGNRFFEGLKGVGRLVTGNTFLDALVKTENAKTPEAATKLKSDDAPLKEAPPVDVSGLGSSLLGGAADYLKQLEEEQKKVTADALKDFEFFIAKKKAMNEMSTADELAAIRRVLATRKVGNQQVILDEEQRRSLLLRSYQLEQKLADDAAKKRKEDNEKRKREREAAEKLEADLSVKLVTLAEGELAGKIAALDQEKANYLKIAQDKAQVEKWYQLERKKLEEDANKDLLDKRKDLTKKLEQETLQALGLTRQLQLQAIRDQALEAKAHGVDEGVIAKWLDAKEKELGAPAPTASSGQGGASTGKPAESATARTFDPGDVAGAFESWGTAAPKFEGFASSRKAEVAGTADLTTGQVKSGFGQIRAELSGGRGGQQSHAQRYGAPGEIPTPEQLANRLGQAAPGSISKAATLGADLTANANATIGALAKGPASFGAANELGKFGQFAPPKPEGPKIQVELVGGPIELAGELRGEDQVATIQGYLDPTGMKARLMGDAPGIPGL